MDVSGVCCDGSIPLDSRWPNTGWPDTGFHTTELSYILAFGDGLKSTFSQFAPVKIEHIVIFSDIEKFRWDPEKVVVDIGAAI